MKEANIDMIKYNDLENSEIEYQTDDEIEEDSHENDDGDNTNDDKLEKQFMDKVELKESIVGTCEEDRVSMWAFGVEDIYFYREVGAWKKERRGFLHVREVPESELL
ncbi:hypothetical protein L873DRAFT_1848133 [Choiromyces venosus 120613-1]|uniref:Uncharacterized protein n=1 Tax=Choiromyces venosus 120613-1 TaxID=1336337 RepID=A0A3N4J3H8_9PEZI|nr:hypothetical protein L873DRAFT_1848133 [Choiromyces venosus 120613-1]